MGFFNILETFFFISLAITFILIIMLVYHFKGRINILEQKCDTMFDIMNNIVKELRTIKIESINQSNKTSMFNTPHNLEEIMKQFHISNHNDADEEFIDEYDEDEDEDADEDECNKDDDDNDDIKIEFDTNNNFQKIIVSDTEQPIKIINIDFNNEGNLDKLDELDELNELDEESIIIDDEQNDDDFTPNYKKMDTNYLRTLVITRGLATDTKKLKKNDLIKLLQ